MRFAAISRLCVVVVVLVKHVVGNGSSGSDGQIVVISGDLVVTLKGRIEVVI